MTDNNPDASGDGLNAIDKAVGRRLKALREAADMTPSALAARSELRPSDIHDFEAGRRRITATQLWQFCDILNLRPKDFYEGVMTSDVATALGQDGGKTLHDVAERFKR